MSISQFFLATILIFTISYSVYLPMVLVLGRLRLADWVGYIVSAIAFAVLVLRLADIGIWFAAVGILLGPVGGAVLAQLTLREYRDGATVRGYFLVGSPPERVQNQLGWLRRGSSDADRTPPDGTA